MSVRWKVRGRGGAMFDGRWRACSALLPLCIGRAVDPDPSRCTCSDPPIAGLCDRYYEPEDGQPANERP